jgi:hypothetical protein
MMTDTDPRARYPQVAPPRRKSKLLDWFPGYKGYHEKETRRDADGALRRMLADDYAQRAQRLTRVQQTLLSARRLDMLAPVEDSHRRLQTFVDRLRTATYGYAGLRDNIKIDERALDQLYQFDLALADGIDDLDTEITAVDQAVSSGGDIQAALRTLNDTIQSLADRFNARADIFQTGQPSANQKLFDVITAPQLPATTAMPLLNINDAVSADGRDWLVGARTRVDGSVGWTDYLLRDGQTQRWLTLPDDPNRPAAMLDPVDFWTRVPPATPIVFGGVSYSLVESVSGAGTILGGGGERTGNVTAYIYTGVDNAYLVLRDWGTDRQALVGHMLNRNDVQMYPRIPQQ